MAFRDQPMYSINKNIFITFYLIFYVYVCGTLKRIIYVIYKMLVTVRHRFVWNVKCTENGSLFNQYTL